MITTLFGIKKNMTSAYDARGRRVGATILEVLPNFVTQIKDLEKDGYNAIQLGMGTKKSVRKPQQGHFKKAGVKETTRFLNEVRTEESVDLGSEISVGVIFKKGDAVKVSATSKGRGFQGGVKRYNFAGGPKTHGQSDRHRAPGSIGSGTTPGRVLKGKRMAGHMGVDQVSYKNLEVLSVDKENNLLMIKGSVPGHTGSLVKITNIGKIKGYIAPPEEKPDEEELEAKPPEASLAEGGGEENAEAMNQENTENKVEEEGSASAEATADKEEGKEDAS